MATIEIMVKRIVEETVTVDFEYHKAHRGHRDSLGVPEEPDEEEEIEINSITAPDGVDITYEDIIEGDTSLEERILEMIDIYW